MSAHQARRVTLFFGLLATLALLVGCGAAAGGGGEGPAAEAVISTDPIQLAPGQTLAQLAWPASEGPVESYLVFESRNGSAYEFTQMVPAPTASVSGQPGDSLQVTVVGISPNGDASPASPPSPPLIFNAAVAAAVAAPAPSGAAPTATSTQASTAPSDTNELSVANAAPSADDLQDSPDDGNTTESTESTESTDDESTTLVAQAMRALLLRADARLPQRGLSSEADQWLQARVDQELAAGVSLAGTGRLDDDGLRELVWQDHAGQLFVSDGQTFLDSDDLPSTFDEAVRLHATERFVGLSDFDGDGLGDWLIEDTATGDVWVIDGATAQPAAAEPSTSEIGTDARLAGHGDFDGDGRAELLWVDSDSRLSLTNPSGDAPTLEPAAASPEAFELLAIADFDGNGRDDVLGRGTDGALVIALAVESGTSDAPRLTIEWQMGPPDLADELDLLATLDLDEDGAAEIAWLHGDELEIWNATSGLQTAADL